MTHRLTAFILAQHKRAKQEKRDAEKIAEKVEKGAVVCAWYMGLKGIHMVYGVGRVASRLLLLKGRN